MKTEIVVALFALIGTLAGTFGGILTSSKLTNYRIEQLEKKQDKYNNVIARTYALEKSVEVLDQRQKVSEHRIEDLENKE